MTSPPSGMKPQHDATAYGEAKPCARLNVNYQTPNTEQIAKIQQLGKQFAGTRDQKFRGSIPTPTSSNARIHKFEIRPGFFPHPLQMNQGWQEPPDRAQNDWSISTSVKLNKKTNVLEADGLYQHVALPSPPVFVQHPREATNYAGFVQCSNGHYFAGFEFCPVCGQPAIPFSRTAHG